MSSVLHVFLLVTICIFCASCEGLRLVGGTWNGEGRVEVFHNGVWGTVCDDSWDINDARVVCRELEYSGAASAPQRAHFGAGSGQIWLDDVACQGSETSIVDCQHRGWGSHNCGHSEDASVICIQSCSTTLNSTFGEIDYNRTSNSYVRCQWSILSVGISPAVALVSMQELNFGNYYCSQYVKITDGDGTDVLYHRGCVPFATENLLDVQFGLSNNISVETYLGSAQSSVKIKFAVLKNGISSASLVSGWNVTVLNSGSTGFTIQWTKLHSNINRVAAFYVILIKSTEETILSVEVVQGTATTVDVRGLKPSSKYRVSVYGVDATGQPYKSLESLTSTTDVFCGVRPSASRIVGGSVAKVNSWPWQAMLTNSYGSHFCGGSLVDHEWVVTAAHCVSGKSPSSIKIKLGAHYRTSGSVGTEQEVGVAKIIMHENYNNPLTKSNDIALIKLITPADLGVGIGLVCMPDNSHALPFDNVYRKCWITGWGTLSYGGYHPNALMEAQVPLVSKQRCQGAYPGKIDDTMLCAGLDEGGVDTCQGDSGGPLVCEFNGTWYLEGATSWGSGCAYARKYGVYAYVRNLKVWISRHIYQVVPPTVFPQNQSVSALVWCYFDNGICSGWNQSSSDDFDWTLASGSTPSSSTGPTSGQGGSGKFMYIETSSPRKPDEKAKLVVTVPNNENKLCLSFYYHMFGATVGTLNVYSGNIKVFNISGNQGNTWMRVERTIYHRSVIFEGITGYSFTSDIAIDSVEITIGSCPVSCNFDNGLCYGWSQSRSDVFDWTLYSGSTPSWNTGPSSDHSGSGKYLYIEASSWSTGDNAKLELAVPRNKSSCCLTFYYHMYGANMGTLNVFSGNNKIFTKSGNQGNYWKKVTRTVYLSDIVSLMYTAGIR